MTEQEVRDTSGWIRGRQGSRAPKEMCVYVLTESQCEQPCKIGSAVDIDRRITTLNSGNPRHLVLRAIRHIPWSPEEKWLAYQKRVQEIERAAHTKLGDVKVRGEWFQIHWEDAKGVIEGL